MNVRRRGLGAARNRPPANPIERPFQKILSGGGSFLSRRLTPFRTSRQASLRTLYTRDFKGRKSKLHKSMQQKNPDKRPACKKRENTHCFCLRLRLLGKKPRECGLRRGHGTRSPSMREPRTCHTLFLVFAHHFYFYLPIVPRFLTWRLGRL